MVDITKDMDKKTDCFLLKEVFGEFFAARNMEREKLKKHIEAGHKGSVLDPRDYARELKALSYNIDRAIELKKTIENAVGCAKTELKTCRECGKTVDIGLADEGDYIKIGCPYCGTKWAV